MSSFSIHRTNQNIAKRNQKERRYLCLPCGYTAKKVRIYITTNTIRPQHPVVDNNVLVVFCVLNKTASRTISEVRRWKKLLRSKAPFSASLIRNGTWVINRNMDFNTVLLLLLSFYAEIDTKIIFELFFKSIFCSIFHLLT